MCRKFLNSSYLSSAFKDVLYRNKSFFFSLQLNILTFEIKSFYMKLKYKWEYQNENLWVDVANNYFLLWHHT